MDDDRYTIVVDETSSNGPTKCASISFHPTKPLLLICIGTESSAKLYDLSSLPELSCRPLLEVANAVRSLFPKFLGRISLTRNWRG